MKIYTKTGDHGTTSLATGERVTKTDPRIEAYGTADELNSFVGNLRAAITDSDIDTQLYYIQNRLFDLGALLAGADLPIGEDVSQQIEAWIDPMQAELPVLRAFILPAGSEAVTRAHLCRTITRRLERNMLAIPQNEDKERPEIVFINRLSDYFFVLARYILHKNGEEAVLWKK